MCFQLQYQMNRTWRESMLHLQIDHHLVFQKRIPSQYFAINANSFSLLSFSTSWSVFTIIVEIKCPKLCSNLSACTIVNWPDSSSDDNHAKLTAVYIMSKYFWAANFNVVHTSAIMHRSCNDRWLKISNKQISSKFMKYTTVECKPMKWEKNRIH